MRYKFIDFVRGTAFIFMIIHHIYYFNPDIKMLPDNVQIIGSYARNIFIFLVGFGIGISKNKSVFTKRNLNLLLGSVIVSLFSYYVLPYKHFIFFGVLHFIFVANFILRPLSNSNLCIIAIGVFSYLMNIYLKEFGGTNDILGLILGRYSISRIPLDIFSIFKWLPLVCAGIIFANLNYEEIEDIYQSGGSKKNTNILRFIELIGENSLTLYLIHVVPCLYWASFKYN